MARMQYYLTHFTAITTPVAAVVMPRLRPPGSANRRLQELASVSARIRRHRAAAVGAVLAAVLAAVRAALVTAAAAATPILTAAARILTLRTPIGVVAGVGEEAPVSTMFPRLWKTLSHQVSSLLELCKGWMPGTKPAIRIHSWQCRHM